MHGPQTTSGLISLRLTAASTSQLVHLSPIRIDQRFFLGTTPTLDLPLGCNAIGDPIEMLRPYKNGRSLEKVYPGKAPALC